MARSVSFGYAFIESDQNPRFLPPVLLLAIDRKHSLQALVSIHLLQCQVPAP